MGLLSRIPWRHRPLVRLAVGFALEHMASGDIEGMPALSDEQSSTISLIREQHLTTVLDQLQYHPQAASMATAVAAAEASGSAHPILDWLFNQGGWQWLYAIAQIVAMFFGIVLPPIPIPPPLPPSPPSPPAPPVPPSPPAPLPPPSPPPPPPAQQTNPDAPRPDGIRRPA